MMRAIVRTDSSQCAPIEVSPDSMRASAPSSTAFAQSLASARVGRGDSIIDSSICVATMTGLACRRATSIARFCTIGTSSSGSSTPRSPRATMTPSKAATISWMRSIACGFSSFAMTGRCTSTSAMTRRTSSMSSGPRTKLSATQSAPCARPQRRSARSFSVSAGTDTATPGRLMPLWSEIRPGTSTSVTTSVSVTTTARSRTRPSSMSNGSPGCTSPGRPVYEVLTIVSSPATSREVIVKRSPIPSAGFCPSAKVPTRILGPCRSSRTATGMPASSEARRSSSRRSS